MQCGRKGNRVWHLELRHRATALGVGFRCLRELRRNQPDTSRRHGDKVSHQSVKKKRPQRWSRPQVTSLSSMAPHGDTLTISKISSRKNKNHLTERWQWHSGEGMEDRSRDTPCARLLVSDSILSMHTSFKSLCAHILYLTC